MENNLCLKIVENEIVSFWILNNLLLVEIDYFVGSFCYHVPIFEKLKISFY